MSITEFFFFLSYCIFNYLSLTIHFRSLTVFINFGYSLNSFTLRLLQRLEVSHRGQRNVTMPEDWTYRRQALPLSLFSLTMKTITGEIRKFKFVAMSRCYDARPKFYKSEAT
jgi:hypothetical protein